MVSYSLVILHFDLNGRNLIAEGTTLVVSLILHMIKLIAHYVFILLRDGSSARQRHYSSI
jgi:hypothetical protein